VHFEDGSSGFGFSHVSREQAESLVGRTLDSLISLENGTAERVIEFPLWDALGQRAGKPIYQLLGGEKGNQNFEDYRLTAGSIRAQHAAPLQRQDHEQDFSVPCYDTSLYFDDLHLSDEKAAADLIAEEARVGYERGHRAFKIKVGRGAMHMPLVEGTQRDIAVIRAVRAAIGAGLPIMIDANNGYNINLAKWVLTDTADCDIYWLEEAFHEDRTLYEHLHRWMDEQGLKTLIADGEGQASPDLMKWAQVGVINVVQYDLRDYGFDNWLKIGKQLDGWGAKSAPHNYGSAYGAYASCHIAAAFEHFAFVEWDQIDLDGLDTSGYAIQDGRVHVPDAPGFGLRLDEGMFGAAVKGENGFVV
jgi:L-alanine-DL-glutamate epimerase-like enolase superfamily enzyme